MSTREPIYGDWSRPGWTCTGYNEYVYARDGIVVAHLRATHRRAYLDGVKYQSFMEAVHAAEAAMTDRDLTPAEARAVIHSYGGGVQSAAIAVLVVQGWLRRPERIVMADTGREATLTWDYLNNHVQPYLNADGLKVEIASHDLASVDTHAKSGDGRPLFPVFTDTGGRLPNLCSVEWKRRVVGRWLRREGYGQKKPVEQWLGISKDEVHRAKPSDLKWASNSFPLLDLNLSRSDCIALVKKAGLPEPPRSSCWMCPFRSDAEWRSLRDRGDGDWEKAIALDESIRKDGVGGELYVHRTAKPLAEVAFKHEGQGDIFDVCEEGRCEF